MPEKLALAKGQPSPVIPPVPHHVGKLILLPANEKKMINAHTATPQFIAAENTNAYRNSTKLNRKPTRSHDGYSAGSAGGMMLVAERIIGKCTYSSHCIRGYFLRRSQTGTGKSAPIKKPKRSGQ